MRARMDPALPVAAVLLAATVLPAPPSALAQARRVLDDQPSWPALRPATADLPMGENRVANPGFEAGSHEAADSWTAYVGGYQIGEGEGRGGGRALRVTNEPATAAHGAVQSIVLDQAKARALYLTGWSRAEGVTGTVDGSYSVYLDLRYMDGTPLYGQRLDFEGGTHDWQRLERFIVPAKPVKSVSFYCLLRYTHAGTVWFDDLVLREVNADLADFDGTAMAVLPPPAGLPGPGGPQVSVLSGDGLALRLGQGGTVNAVEVGSQAVSDSGRHHLGGVLVRDVGAGSDVVHVGGPLAAKGDRVTQTASADELGLLVSSSWQSRGDRIAWHAAVTDTRGMDRAVALYLALPMTTTGLVWFHDLRASQAVEGRSELLNASLYRGLGSTGAVSRYPWAAVGRGTAGLALALPLDQPRVARLVQNPVTGQLYAAFDLGLSGGTASFASSAWVDLTLYRFDPSWGLRAAAQGYYDRFPDGFARRFPADREGVWVAFSDLASIPDIADFGIAFHELGSLSQVSFDDSAGIASFRYIAEPWSHWLAIADASVDATEYAQAASYLEARAAAGDRRAAATLASGFHDANGMLVYEPTVAPWCSGAGGCAVFTVNPDPDIPVADQGINKGLLEWSDSARATYRDLGLDGEYIDSYLGRALALDLRRDHFAAADTPLTFRTSDRRVGTPEVFATTEFARWVTGDVHDNLGKWTMANGVLLDLPWGADLFDFMGTETNWMRNGVFTPEPDDRLLYRRALAGRRPYGLLMNTDFDAFGHDLVEAYFQISLFYAFYPSMFSHDASSDRYWDDPRLYERDRGLFRRYVPLIRALSAAGWQPVTRAASSSADVLVERYGQWPELYMALRNTAPTVVTATLALEPAALSLPSAEVRARRLLAGGTVTTRAGGAGRAALDVPMAPSSIEVLQLRGSACYLPVTTR